MIVRLVPLGVVSVTLPATTGRPSVLVNVNSEVPVTVSVFCQEETESQAVVLVA